MPAANHKLRNLAEDLIRSEIVRVGPDRIDRKAMMTRLTAEGCSKTRAYA